MAASYKFCDTPQGIFENVILFAEEDLPGQAIVHGSEYFIHIQWHDRHLFAPSKWVGFKDITMSAYLFPLRKKVSGGTVQKHIENATKTDWTHFQNLSPIIKSHFSQWIKEILPTYRVNKAKVMTIAGDNHIAISHLSEMVISPKELKALLEIRQRIGEVGEEIAIEYERKRLEKEGCENIDNCLDHTSKWNTAAGYDIESKMDGNRRFIEVKSSVNPSAPFYLSRKEYEILSNKGKEAFIYRVIISDLEKRVGRVYKEICDPIAFLQANAEIEPNSYKVSIDY